MAAWQSLLLLMMKLLRLYYSSLVFCTVVPMQCSRESQIETAKGDDAPPSDICQDFKGWKSISLLHVRVTDVFEGHKGLLHRLGWSPLEHVVRSTSFVIRACNRNNHISMQLLSFFFNSQWITTIFSMMIHPVQAQFFYLKVSRLRRVADQRLSQSICHLHRNCPRFHAKLGRPRPQML